MFCVQLVGPSGAIYYATETLGSGYVGAQGRRVTSMRERAIEFETETKAEEYAKRYDFLGAGWRVTVVKGD